MRRANSFNVKPFTTFGIDANTAIFIEAETIGDLDECRKQGLLSEHNLLIIGGGSNLLFCNYHNGVTLRPAMKGITIEEYSSNHVVIEAKAGEVWDDLVAYCVENAFYGLENLSFIPGNVGASPVQNIGAYGVEVQSAIERVEAYDIETGSIRYFTNKECQFAYRESIFKNELKGKYIVIAVQFKLSLLPCLNIEYKDVQAYLANQTEITLKTVRDAIIAIRKEKLPDPAVVGNAGSFFKNPVVSAQKAEALHHEFPMIVTYPLANGSRKIAAGWLIDKAGWKGFRCGDAGVHPTQALCLVNYGSASGKEILDLSIEIQESVFKMFGIEIEPEVRIIMC